MLVPIEHRFDAGQPGHGLLLFAIGIGQGKVDARPHRSALPHFVEQVSHGSTVESAGYRIGIIPETITADQVPRWERVAAMVVLRVPGRLRGARYRGQSAGKR